MDHLIANEGDFTPNGWWDGGRGIVYDIDGLRGGDDAYWAFSDGRKLFSLDPYDSPFNQVLLGSDFDYRSLQSDVGHGFVLNGQLSAGRLR